MQKRTSNFMRTKNHKECIARCACVCEAVRSENVLHQMIQNFIFIVLV